MISKTFSCRVLFLSLLLPVVVMRPAPSAAQDKPATSAGDSTQQPAADVKGTDVRGTWSGTFFSKHQNIAPFTMTLVINPDSGGRLVGSSTLNSDCLKGVQLEVKVTGSKVVLAGSDPEGDNITVRGTVDKAGQLLKATYILNGSATGRCETDGGTASLAKR